MSIRKVLLFIILLPLTLFLDFILYGLLKSCPACGSFWSFLSQEGAISFPIVVGITQWFSNFFPSSKSKSTGKNRL